MNLHARNRRHERTGRGTEMFLWEQAIIKSPSSTCSGFSPTHPLYLSHICSVILVKPPFAILHLHILQITSTKLGSTSESTAELNSLGWTKKVVGSAYVMFDVWTGLKNGERVSRCLVWEQFLLSVIFQFLLSVKFHRFSSTEHQIATLQNSTGSENRITNVSDLSRLALFRKRRGVEGTKTQGASLYSILAKHSAFGLYI